ncbi:MAG: F0F1 ATP synthase subunit gamma [bacterium]|nr:F0F1 ATP synthase subunit gamma [bacterium]
MASLQELRHRQQSVKSTRKITQAMKMIAAAKLRKAQERAEAGRPYANLMAGMVDDLVARALNFDAAPSKLLTGKAQDKTRMLIVVTSDRGLCGGFNGAVVRRARALAKKHEGKGRKFKFFCIGRKGYEQLRFEYRSHIVEWHPIPDKPSYSHAAELGARLIDLFEEDVFDRCALVYNRFVSAMTQEVRAHRLIPFKPFPEAGMEGLMEEVSENEASTSEAPGVHSFYEYEPGEEQILEALLPKNVAIQVYRALLESAAGEQGARMTAMDSATRNAGDMIRDLQLEYNRTRQAHITRELIEIISGAEAL